MQSVSIPMPVLENLLDRLNAAIDVCANAESTDYRDPLQDPTRTYPGATGWSRSAMTQAVHMLSSCRDAEVVSSEMR